MKKTKVCPSCGKTSSHRLQQTRDGVQAVCECCANTTFLDDDSAAALRRRHAWTLANLSRLQQAIG